jgi:protein TonB
MITFFPQWSPYSGPLNKKKHARNGRLVILSLLLALMATSTNAQQTDSTSSALEVEEELIFVEEMPEFPGGEQKLYEHISKNVLYPPLAIENNIQGNVIISFIVEKDGSIRHAEVLKSVHPLLDKEALRVVGSMPKWKPGKQKGKAVRVRYNLPIRFNLM